MVLRFIFQINTNEDENIFVHLYIFEKYKILDTLHQ